MAPTSLFAGVALAVVAPCVRSQVPTAAPIQELRQQLQAAEPASVAWAAYEAGRRRATELAPDLRRVLAGLRGADWSEATVRFTARSVFDALVRTNARLAPKELAPWMPRFPSMTLVLAARDVDRHAGLLLSGCHDRRSDAHWMASCNLLLTGAPAMLTPELLATVKVTLTITVMSPSEFHSTSWSTSIGRGCGTVQRPPGFPPTARYALVAGRPANGVVFAPGPQPIAWLRTERRERAFGIGAHSHNIDRADYALRCLCQLAGRALLPRRLKSQMATEIRWSNAESYRTAAASAAADVRAEFADLVADLAEQQLLSPGARRQHELVLRVAVKDERTAKDRATALPDL